MSIIQEPSVHHPGSGPRPDPELPDEASGAFRDLLQTSFDPATVEKWVSAAPIRRSLFDDMAVGRIRWPRALGRPDAPNLFDGFEVRVRFWDDIWHVGADGSVIVDAQGWLPGLSPELRDGNAEPDHYSVRYLLHAKADNDNEVEVRFSGLPWHRPGRSAHHRQLFLSSHGFRFFSDGHFMTLPDIDVDDRPFAHP